MISRLATIILLLLGHHTADPDERTFCYVAAVCCCGRAIADAIKGRRQTP